MSQIIDLLNCCDICGEGHTTDQCPELIGIPIDPNLGDYMTRARLTLPNCLEAIDQRIGYCGVYAKELIPAKTQLGPFEAKRTTHIFDDTGFFTLKLVSKSGSTVCLDTTDENECNWLCLVRPAISQDAQNCMAYQLGSNIFYSTMEDVLPGIELQVWYTSMYARKIGKSIIPDGVSKALLGHKIVPISIDLPTEPVTENVHEPVTEHIPESVTQHIAESVTESEAGLPIENVPDETDKLQQDQPEQTKLEPNKVIDDSNIKQTHKPILVHAEIRGEIKKVSYCPRCGQEFTSQSYMVQHLREHIMSNGRVLTQKKRGRGRPRIHPGTLNTDASSVKFLSKRPRGRPRKNLAYPTGQKKQFEPASEPLIADISNRTEAAEPEVDNTDEEYDEVINGEADYDIDEDSRACKRFKIDEELDNSVDKDYTPVLEIRCSGRRVQPGRSRKGRNTKLMEDYIVGKVGKGKDELTTEDLTPVDPIESPVKEGAEVQIVKRKRGRPRKIDLIKAESDLTKNSSSLNNNKLAQTERGIEPDSKISLAASLGNKILNSNNDLNKETCTINENTTNTEDQPIVKLNQESYLNDSCEVNNYELGNDNVSVSEIDAKKHTNQETKPVKSDTSSFDNSERIFHQNDLVASFDSNQRSGLVMIKNEKVNSENQVIESKISQNPIESNFEGNTNIVINTDMNKCNLDIATDEMYPINHDTGDLIDDSGNNHSDTIVKEVNKASIPEDPLIEEQKELLQAANNSENIQNNYKPNKDGPHVCDICRQEFKTAMYLYRHMVMHTDMFRCVQCRKTFSRKDSMQKHVLKCCPDKAESLRILHCEKCMRVFSTASGKKKHMAKCDLVICDRCNGRFRSNEDLDQHICQKDSEKGAYSCGKCSKSFQSLHYLKQHSLTHKNLHTCFRCNKSLPSKDDLDSHSISCETLESIKLVGQGQCQKCQEVFNSAKQFREHILTHTHPFQCEHCQRRFIKVGSLSNHECLHTAEFKACNICSKQFKSLEELDQHISHHECLKYQCSVCQKQFYMKSDARNHECDLDVPEEERQILYAPDCTEMCSVCGKSFSSKSNLQKHLMLHGEKKLQCPHCDKKFHLQVYLRQHINSFHFQLTKFQCLSCGKMFKSKSGLNMHNALFHNTNFPSFQCTKCYKDFFSKGRLNVHMYKHSTERKFKCQVCDKVFKYPDQLSRHRAEHNPDEKYSCIYCEKQFSQKYSLKRHLQIYHSGYVYVCGICSAKCCHKHTLLRHYKRKHTDSLDLLNEKGYVKRLLKHVSTLPGYNSEEVTPVETNQEVTDTSTELPEETVRALTSLSMGTCTVEEYQILKDRGLIKADEIDQQFGLPMNQTLIVSDDGHLIQTQKQMVIPQDQLLQQNDNTIAGMNEQIGIIQNPDGTININDIHGLPQTLETLESKDGQIVILQIVEASDQVTQALNQGEVVQQLPVVNNVLEGEHNENVVSNTIQIVKLPEGLGVTTAEGGILEVDNLINQQTGTTVRQSGEHLLQEVNQTNGEADMIVRQNEADLIVRQNEGDIVIRQNDVDMIVRQNVADMIVRQNEANMILRQNEADMIVRQNDADMIGRQNETDMIVEQNGEMISRQNEGDMIIRQNEGDMIVEQNGEMISRQNQGDTIVRQNEPEGIQEVSLVTEESEMIVNQSDEAVLQDVDLDNKARDIINGQDNEESL